MQSAYGNGTKSETFPGSGVWRLRVHVVDRDGRAHKPSKTVKGLTPTQANRALAEFLADQREHLEHFGTILQGDGPQPLEVLFKEWLADFSRKVARGDRSPVTEGQYRASVEALVPLIGELRVDELRRRDVRRLFERLVDEGMARSTATSHYRALRTALSWAVDEDTWGIEHNPAAGRNMVPEHRSPRRLAPERCDLERLLDALAERDPDLAAALVFDAMTGIRRGDLCGLRWSDIDWAKNRVTVQRSLVVVRGRGVIEKGRTKATRAEPLVRSLDTAGRGRHALECIRALQKSRAKEAGARLPDNGWIVSLDGLGHEPRKPDSITRKVKRVSSALSLDITPHDLRRYMVSECDRAGLTLDAIGAFIGHGGGWGDQKVTEGYRTLREERLQQVADVAGGSIELPAAAQREGALRRVK